jgi:hypothetical protein
MVGDSVSDPTLVPLKATLGSVSIAIWQLKLEWQLRLRFAVGIVSRMDSRFHEPIDLNLQDL